MSEVQGLQFLDEKRSRGNSPFLRGWTDLANSSHSIVVREQGNRMTVLKLGCSVLAVVVLAMAASTGVCCTAAVVDGG